MNYILVIITLIFWLIIAVLDYSELCYFWQLKEYRKDRFLDFLSTKQGKDFLKSYLVFGRSLFLVLLILVLLFRIKFSVEIIFIWFLAESLRYAFKFLKKKIHRPKITLKSLLMILSPIAAELIVLFFFHTTAVIVGIYIARFLTVSFFVALFSLPTRILKKIYIILAARKIRKYKNLRIIGVTGSYGKTSVKNFLKQILDSSFKVIATPKNINTEIGIAKFILQQDFSGVDIFVVEMGAYKKGEIKLICDMARPEIGVLTAISEQHLSLFGSIENIQSAKYELLFSLPEKSLAVINSDNKYCREFSDKLKCQVKTFGREKKFKPNCLIEKINAQNNQINFNCVLENKNLKITAPVPGEHNAMNIAACILAADYLGISKEKIIAATSNVELPVGTLGIHSYGNSIIIDDSYNANPDGFLAALKVLESYAKDFKKIVITRGMIELGEKSPELHQKVGKRISEVAEELIIISEDNEQDLRSGAGKIKILSIYNFDDLLAYVKNFKEDKCVVLLENRIPNSVMKELL